MTTRTIVGIDLGTTNCAVAYVDLTAGNTPQILPIPQLVAPGQVDAFPTLPSFLYLPLANEQAGGAVDDPIPVAWSGAPTLHGAVVGRFARDHGADNPLRLVTSAKSWLCHDWVDRRAPILPWAAPTGVPRVSPVEAAARILAHIRGAWNAAMPASPLEEQAVVITLPASFDATARQLTIEAIRLAGITQFQLLEEPQAAFYAWLAWQGESWHGSLAPGQTILVVDVGGGTTDFSLIRAVECADAPLALRRIAVGNHLLLGGDNMDAALARNVEQQWRDQGARLAPDQWLGLVQRARALKEQILAAPDAAALPAEASLSLPGRGRAVIGGALTAAVATRAWADQVLQGFFPHVTLGTPPETGEQGGLSEFGLPYAKDPAITRHLGHFLHQHLASEAGRWSAWPEHILFNGGVFRSALLRRRVLDVVAAWTATAAPGREVAELANPQPDLAVAIGAAYYGMARLGRAPRVAAGLPRSYYVELAAAGRRPTLLCIAPRGAEAGEEMLLDQHPLELRIGEPVRFPFYSSTSRPQDRPGALLAFDPDRMLALPPLAARLRAGKRTRPRDTAIILRAWREEIGTLRVQCVEPQTGHAWDLEIEDRPPPPPGDAAQPASTAAPLREVLETERLARAAELLDATFSGAAPAPPALPGAIETALDLPRDEWPLTALRRLADRLWERRDGRRRSPEHEARWLNLIGFCLRPGIGDPLDPWRINRVWGLRHEPLAHPRHAPAAIEGWILWRRIAPGLAYVPQQELSARAIAALHPTATRDRRRAEPGPATGEHERAELWRLVASLERLAPDAKAAAGAELLPMLADPARRRLALWCLGRLGARQPFAPTLETVLPPDDVTPWIDAILDLPDPLPPEAGWSLGRLAHQTGDRFRDIPDDVRARAAARLRALADSGDPAAASSLEWLARPSLLSARDQEGLLGEHLPIGLRWAGPQIEEDR